MAIRSLRALQTQQKKIDIFDAYAEEKNGTGAPVKIAEVTVRGGKGSVVVFNSAFEGTVRSMFEQPTMLFAGGQRAGTDKRDLGADAVVVLDAWSDGALEHAMKHGLPAHRLRAALR